MSSSKVIKPEQLKDHRVFNVNYKILVGSADAERDPQKVYLGADGFTPMFFNDSVGPRDKRGGDKQMLEGGSSQDSGEEPEVERVPLEEGMLVIAEDDLQRRVADAYARGLEEGRLAAERGLANVFRALREGLDGLDSLRGKVLRDSEGDLLALAILVARKVILQELKVDQDILAKIIAATVNCCSELDKITIRLHPDDYRLVMENRHHFLAAADDESRVTLAQDESIRLGGCQVDTPTGTVDARIETQLEEIFRRCLEEGGIPYESSVSFTD